MGSGRVNHSDHFRTGVVANHVWSPLMLARSQMVDARPIWALLRWIASFILSSPSFTEIKMSFTDTFFDDDGVFSILPRVRLSGVEGPPPDHIEVVELDLVAAASPAPSLSSAEEEVEEPSETVVGFIVSPFFVSHTRILMHIEAYSAYKDVNYEVDRKEKDEDDDDDDNDDEEEDDDDEDDDDDDDD
ncbi:hypothetical protein BU24DRAFT_414479 [Aaosphaeria arxii CBS 175.79]|uniref:Uncharacterized protein n=1 Tax=Aaosphaeria arxii CBS 175.79 TaxID=1450172 RepID=A0A6A5XAN2_9PLEO|nr:uncharacterized protein BU24DRAFT_414479 [Aaosphaeria arxii CBS 175.79]KAF2010038.1 hypothetical protein BU24DRAFT_414479 [Aaosphaeria arxii CBS 175.79]